DAATSTTYQSLGFGYDANDTITSITNGRSALLTQNFQYDELTRLTSAARGDGVTEGFGYDANGNRTSYTKTAVAPQTLTYASTSNRLSSAAGPSPSRSWSYNANGDTTAFTGADGVSVTSTFDGFGRS